MKPTKAERRATLRTMKTVRLDTPNKLLKKHKHHSPGDLTRVWSKHSQMDASIRESDEDHGCHVKHNKEMREKINRKYHFEEKDIEIGFSEDSESFASSSNPQP